MRLLGKPQVLIEDKLRAFGAVYLSKTAPQSLLDFQRLSRFCLNRYLFCLMLVPVILAACQAPFSPTATAEPPPPTDTLQPTSTSTPEPGTVAAFQAIVAQAEGLDEMERKEIVNRHMAQITATPLTSGGRVAFLWQGSGQSVRLVGDMNNWDINSAPALTQLSGTDLWYLIIDYEPDARLDYKFAVDDTPWRLDPLNPRTVMSGTGPNSELVMPGYQVPPEFLPSDREIPAGKLTSHTLESRHLGQTRTFFVYEPPGQLIGRLLPSVYIHDGTDYLNLINATVILDRLIADRQIPPLVAVFIPPINRDLEYLLNNDYVLFLADELVPFVRERYETDPDSSRTAILGASKGGLAALHAAFSRPYIFGLAASQSGALSLDNNAIIRRFDRPRVGVAGPAIERIYLVAGTYETAVQTNSGAENFLDANRDFSTILERLNYTYHYEERPEGHSWGLWRGTLGRALAYLFNN